MAGGRLSCGTLFDETSFCGPSIGETSAGRTSFWGVWATSDIGCRSGLGSNLELERLRPKLGSIGIGYKGVSVAFDVFRDEKVGSSGILLLGASA